MLIDAPALATGGAVGSTLLAVDAAPPPAFSVGCFPWKSLLTIIQPDRGRTWRFGAGYIGFSGVRSVSTAEGVLESALALVESCEVLVPSSARKEDTFRAASCGVYGTL